MTEPTPAPAAQPAAPFTEAEDKQYSTLATFLNIILLVPALVFYFGFRTRGPKIGEQSKENLNWTINVTGIWIVALILSIILTLIPFVGWIIGILLTLVIWAVLIVNLIFSILGGVKLNGTGETYRYPVNIRWIK
ncbi:MAG: DUF4870 domain-containing protein [Actinomycetota bacterium]